MAYLVKQDCSHALGFEKGIQVGGSGYRLVKGNDYPRTVCIRFNVFDTSHLFNTGNDFLLPFSSILELIYGIIKVPGIEVSY